MNISEVKKMIEGASYEEKIQVLENICRRVGDRLENGYLGSSVANISYDDFGYVEFQSEKVEEAITTQSKGTVLDNSVIIMQVQQSTTNKLLNLYSWKLDGSSYTYFAFDSKAALEHAYQAIKKTNKGFLAENLDNDLQELGIMYRDIMNVKVAVKAGEMSIQTEMTTEDMQQSELLTSFSI